MKKTNITKPNLKTHLWTTAENQTKIIRLCNWIQYKQGRLSQATSIPSFLLQEDPCLSGTQWKVFLSAVCEKEHWVKKKNVTWAMRELNCLKRRLKTQWKHLSLDPSRFGSQGPHLVTANKLSTNWMQNTCKDHTDKGWERNTSPKSSEMLLCKQSLVYKTQNSEYWNSKEAVGEIETIFSTDLCVVVVRGGTS